MTLTPTGEDTQATAEECVELARRGDLPRLLKWFDDCDWPRVLTAASEGGHWRTIFFAADRCDDPSQLLFEAACRLGDLEMVKTFNGRKSIRKKLGMVKAVENRQFHIIHHFLDTAKCGITMLRDPDDSPDPIFDNAVLYKYQAFHREGAFAAGRCGFADIVEILLNDRPLLNSYALDGACLGGHPTLVRRLVEEGLIPNGRTLRLACEGRNEEIVATLLDRIDKTLRDWSDDESGDESGDESDDESDYYSRICAEGLYGACLSGSLPLVELMIGRIANLGPIRANKRYLLAACNGNFLPIARRLLTDGPSDEVITDVFIEACCVDQEEFAVLIYEHSPRSQKVICEGMASAIARGGIGMALTIVDRWCTDIEEALLWACRKGGAEIADRLIGKGATNLDAALEEASAKGADSAVIQLLIERGATDLVTGLIQAAFHGHFQLVRYLADLSTALPVERREPAAPPGVLSIALQGAVKSGSLTAVRLIVEEGAPEVEDAMTRARALGQDHIVEYFHSLRFKPGPKPTFVSVAND